MDDMGRTLTFIFASHTHMCGEHVGDGMWHLHPRCIRSSHLMQECGGEGEERRFIRFRSIHRSSSRPVYQYFSFFFSSSFPFLFSRIGGVFYFLFWSVVWSFGFGYFFLSFYPDSPVCFCLFFPFAVLSVSHLLMK